MLIINDTKPEKSLYAIGAYILKTFSFNKKEEFDLEDLFSKFKILYSEDISLSYFIYGLDWLYLCDKISFDKGKIKLI